MDLSGMGEGAVGKATKNSEPTQEGASATG
jgi:hypothetical protein